MTDPNWSPKPKRGYSWAPFQPGHEINLTHGARSPKRVKPLAAAISAELVRIAPHTAVPAFAPAVEAWAYAEAQCRLLREYLDENGLLDDDGNERNAANFLGKCEGRADKLRQQLGLTPMAMVVLHRAFAADPEAPTVALDGVIAMGRQIREAQAMEALTEAHSAPGDDGDGDDDDGDDGDD